MDLRKTIKHLLVGCTKCVCGHINLGLLCQNSDLKKTVLNYKSLKKIKFSKYFSKVPTLRAFKSHLKKSLAANTFDSINKYFTHIWENSWLAE